MSKRQCKAIKLIPRGRIPFRRCEDDAESGDEYCGKHGGDISEGRQALIRKVLPPNWENFMPVAAPRPPKPPPEKKKPRKARAKAPRKKKKPATRRPSAAELKAKQKRERELAEAHAIDILLEGGSDAPRDTEPPAHQHPEYESAEEARRRLRYWD